MFARPYTDRARAASCCLAIDRFETYLRVTGSLAARRVRNYFHYPLLAILPEFRRNEGIESVQDLGRDAVTRLVLSLEERQRKDGAPISPPTRVAYLKAIRQFLNWAAEEGIWATGGAQIGVPTLRRSERMSSQRTSRPTWSRFRPGGWSAATALEACSTSTSGRPERGD